MQVLNLYSCLGGNRLKWDNCNVVAVEKDPYLAEIYQERFPDDEVIIGDAHKYLLKYFSDFDFIWSSPPCPTHSKARFWGSKGGKCELKYPDLKLYEEIIFLKHYAKKSQRWVVENVNPYYEPLIPGSKRGRHIYWSNFKIPKKVGRQKDPASKRMGNEFSRLCDFHRINLDNYKGGQRKIKIARNLVHYRDGEIIFLQAKGAYKKENEKNLNLFSDD